MGTYTISYGSDVTSRRANSNSGWSATPEITAPTWFSAYTKVTKVYCVVPLHSDLNDYPSGSFSVTLPNGSTTSSHSFTMRKADNDYNETGSWDGRSDTGCLSGGTYKVNISISGNVMSWFHYWIGAPSITLTYTSPTVTVTPVAGTGGTVSGGGTVTIVRNDTAYTTTITATPQDGYHFVKWSDGSTSASRTLTFSDSTIIQNATSLTYSATFAPNQYTVSTSAKVNTLNQARNDTELVAVSGVSVSITDINNVPLTNGGAYDYGSTVRFQAPATYTDGTYDMALIRWDWTVGSHTGSVNVSDSGVGTNGSNRFFDYSTNSVAAADGMAIAVYERKYHLTVSGTGCAATVRTSFDSADKQLSTAQTYTRTATELAATSGTFAMTVVTTADYGIRNSSTIPNVCVLRSGYNLKNQTTVWDVSPVSTTTSVAFVFYKLHYELTFQLFDTNDWDNFYFSYKSPSDASYSVPTPTWTSHSSGGDTVYSYTYRFETGCSIRLISYTGNLYAFDGELWMYDTTAHEITASSTGIASTNYHYKQYDGAEQNMVVMLTKTPISFRVGYGVMEDNSYTIPPSESTYGRCATANMTFAVPDTYHIVSIEASINNGTPESRSNLLADPSVPYTYTNKDVIETTSLTHGVPAQDGSITYTLCVANILRSHSFTIVLTRDDTEYLFIHVSNAEHGYLVVTASYSDNTSIAHASVSGTNSDLQFLRRNLTSLSILPVADVDASFVACNGTWLVGDDDAIVADSDSLFEIDNPAVVSSLTHNNGLYDWVNDMTANPTNIYQLDLDPCFMLNTIYIKDSSGVRRPKTVWQGARFVNEIYVGDHAGIPRKIYGVDGSSDDAQFAGDRAAYYTR